jgi:hypothetical protein
VATAVAIRGDIGYKVKCFTVREGPFLKPKQAWSMNRPMYRAKTIRLESELGPFIQMAPSQGHLPT